jgi:UDPglucose 6-dehydrogenase
MRIAVIGTGYVGLVAGAGFSDFGNDVVCVDLDARRVERLRRGEIPIHEPGLEELVARNLAAGRLAFTTSAAEAVPGAEVVIIAVGTPTGDGGAADLRFVEAAARDIGRALTGYAVIVTKSTVPVGTADKVRAWVGAETRQPFAVASNPEFLKEGDAVNDFMKPARVILGADDPRAEKTLRSLYAAFVRTNDRVLVMDIRSAELTKYAANAMLATRISFMNELALLAEKVGADIEKIRAGVGSDPRIGNKFLYAGAGWGGSCLAGRETVLVRSNGRVSLERLDSLILPPHGAEPAIDHPHDLEVLALPANGGAPAFLPVEAITCRPFEGDICEIRTKMGRRVLCTPDHPLVVVDENGDNRRTVLAEDVNLDDWVPVANAPATNAGESAAAFDILGSLASIRVKPERVIARVGDRVRTDVVTEALRASLLDTTRLHDIRRSGALRVDEAEAAGVDLSGAALGTTTNGTYIPAAIPNDAAFWHLIGLYCSEGWITSDIGKHGATRMRISWAFHPELEEHLVEEVASFWTRLGVKTRVMSTKTSRQVTVSSRLLGLWLLRGLGIGKDCYSQRVPDALWTAPESSKRAFLAGLWHGDGSWSYVANRRGIVWEYGTVSRELADGVLRLLGELGIVAGWKIGRPPGATVDTHFVRISGADQVESVLDFGHPGERATLERSIAGQTKRIAPTGYRGSEEARVRIVELGKRHFQGHVYSLEVPGAHTFVTTGGLVVHNCFPKDTRALIQIAGEVGGVVGIVEAVEKANERQKKVLGERVVAHHGGSLAGKKVAVWGLAFKPETDDVRESPALVVIGDLLAAGASVTACDPVAIETARAELGGRIEYTQDMYAAVGGADALVLVTEWKQFRHPDFKRLAAAMRTPVLFDGRNIWSPAEVREQGFIYYGIGRS